MSEEQAPASPKLTPDVEARGLKAYEQVCAFERLRSWRLPLAYALVPFFPLVLGLYLWHAEHDWRGPANFASVAAILIGEFLHWRRLVKRYTANLRVVNEMERTYGDQLQWVKVEKHFAALEKLQRELAAEKRERDKS